MSRSRMMVVAGSLGAAALGVACKDKPAENLAPVASALSDGPKPVASAPAAAQTLGIVKDSSKLSFSMEAPVEKISGEADASLDGQLLVNVTDLSQSSGLVRADLNKLVLFQEKRDSEKGEFSARTKNDLQNQHARTWLEISDDVPEKQRADYSVAEYKISRLESPSISNLAQLSGSERKVTATAVGEFRLHGRKSEKRAKMDLVFGYSGDQLSTVRVVSVEPLAISLEEFDVRPREAFGKLAQKTLSALGSKVAQSAPIRVEFTARAQ